MLKPVEMVKVRIYALRDLKEDVVDFLHREGVLHITYPSIKGKGKPLIFEWYEELSKYAVELRGICKALNLKPKKAEIRAPDVVLSEAKILYAKLEKVKALLAEKKEAEEEMAALSKELKRLSFFTSLYKGKAPSSLSVAAAIGEEKAIASLIRELRSKNLLVGSEVKRRGNRRVALLLVKPGGERIVNYFEGETFIYPKDLAKVIEEKKSRLEELKAKVALLKESINEAKEKYAPSLCTLVYELNVYSERANAAEKFMESKQFFIAEGWIPKPKYEKFKTKLFTIFGNNVAVEEVEAHDPPTLLDNPKEISAFQKVVEMISLPKGDSIDPTKVIAFTLPLLYGMIIGDVIYSLMAMAFALWIKKSFKSKLAQMAGEVWLLSSIAGVGWGIVFDEWMGSSHFFWLSKLGILSHPLYIGFSRMHNLNLLMAVSILIGVAHLILGFLLGAYGELSHSKKHAIGKVGFALFLLSVTLLLLSFAGAVPPFKEAYAALLIISLLAILYGEGVVGLMETISVIGNSISYVRVAAVGIVGVVVAELLNELIGGGFWGLLVFIIVLALHFANAVVAMFEGLIQGGRLNFVEFATKAYKGGGKKYSPFMLR